MEAKEFDLIDRLQKIRSINEMYDLEHNAYISYSGGKDSTVLSHLVDEALPGNTIPRVYLNTGIEYKKVSTYVEKERERERRPYKHYPANAEYKNYFGTIRLPFQKQRAQSLCVGLSK